MAKVKSPFDLDFPEDKKKKKNTSQILPTISEEGQKLFDTTGQAVQPLLPKLEPQTVQDTVQDVTQPLTPALTQETVVTPEVTQETVETPVAEVQQTTVTPSTEINDRIAQLSRQRAIDKLRSAFEGARASEQQRLSEIPGEFRELQRGVRTRDVMQAEADRKRAALGATGSGSLAQSDIARNISTQGQIGALGIAEQQAKDQVKARIAQLERDLAGGIADINTQTELAQLQQQLDLTVQQEAQALKQAEIQDQRDYDLFLRELDKFDAREKLVFQNELERENTILDAQIQEARDNRNFRQESALIAQRNANDIKLEGVRQANRLEEIEARNLEQPATQTAEQEFETDLLRNELDNFVKGAEDIKFAAASWLVQNIDFMTEQQFEKFKLDYRLQDSDLEDAQSKIFNISPSVGT